MPKGGKRAGAGRKLGTRLAKPQAKPVPKPVREQARELFEARAARELSPLIDATMRAACGAQVCFGFDPTTSKWLRLRDPDKIEAVINVGDPFLRIETEAPDAKVLTGLLDRLLGKVVEEHAVAGTLTVRWSAE